MKRGMIFVLLTTLAVSAAQNRQQAAPAKQQQSFVGDVPKTVAGSVAGTLELDRKSVV